MVQNPLLATGLIIAGVMALVVLLIASNPQLVPQNSIVVDYRCQDFSQKISTNQTEVLFSDGSRCTYSTVVVNSELIEDELGKLTIQKIILDSECKGKELEISPYNVIADPNTEGLYVANQKIYWCQGLFGT